MRDVVASSPTIYYTDLENNYELRIMNYALYLRITPNLLFILKNTTQEINLEW
jgi:hypothetical protein